MNAKQFFADRVIQQAATENVTLSDAERAMLLWSESDPDVAVDVLDRALRLHEEMSDEEYEAKISGLLERAFNADVAADAQALERWRHSLQALNQGDHYIAIMIERAVGSRLKSWWQFWR